MSTRSTIAYENADGTIKKVYCHYDGYLEHNGKILAEHYSNHADWKRLCYGNDIRGFGIDSESGTANPSFFDRDFDTPMFPEPYADFAAYVASIDHVFHEFNYIMRKDGKMEVIKGDWKRADKNPIVKCLSLKRCLGRLKAKQFLQTKNSMNPA